MESIATFLSLFSYLLISMGVYFLSKIIRVPYTVLLVVTGVLLIPISNLFGLSFLSSFSLTPDILFFVFLPILIFESAYNIKLRKLKENQAVIFLLSVVSFLISAFFIGFVGQFALGLLGLQVPFLVTLLFGTIISATDPVAVLALFKDFGAPRKLAMIFEGESLFNDATAFALFLILIEIIQTGFHGSSSLGHAAATFATMLVGGLIFGLIFGGIFSKLIEKIKNNQKVELTLTMIVAHLAFIFTELISEQLFIGDFNIQISSIVATVTASMVIGNYGRYKISPKIEEYMDKFWDYFAFVANSLVFLMMGVLFASLFVGYENFALPLFVMIVVVCLARVISIYPILGCFNIFSKSNKVPRSWQHLLAAGDLKGALAVIMILLIPSDLTVTGFSQAYSIKEFLTVLTVGYVFFTLFVKATSLGFLIDKLKLNKLSSLEKIEYQESKALIYSKVLAEIKKSYRTGYINRETYLKLKIKYQKLYKSAYTRCGKLVTASSKNLEKLLRVYAIGIEKHALKQLLILDEIPEKVYRILLQKMDLQLDLIEKGKTKVHKTYSFLPKKFWDRFWFRIMYGQPVKKDASSLYTYYRALRIISKKVLDELETISSLSHIKDFDRKQTFDYISSIYEGFLRNSTMKMNKVYKANKMLTSQLDVSFANKEIHDIEDKVIAKLLEKDMITPKLFVLLENEIQRENA